MLIDENWFLFFVVLCLFDLVWLSLVDFEGLDFGDCFWDLVNYYGFEVFEGFELVVIELVCCVGLIGKSIVSEIDFMDMVWFLVVYGYMFFMFSWVFVDEC